VEGKMRKKFIFVLSLNPCLFMTFLLFFTPPVSAAPPQPPNIEWVYVEFARGEDLICTEFTNKDACWKLHIEGTDFATTTEGVIDDDWDLLIGCKPKVDKSVCILDIHEDPNSDKRPSTIDCLIDNLRAGPCEATVSTSKGSSTFVCNILPTPSSSKTIEGRRWQCTQM
jgi:hypothetical protein